MNFVFLCKNFSQRNLSKLWVLYRKQNKTNNMINLPKERKNPIFPHAGIYLVGPFYIKATIREFRNTHFDF